MPKESEIEAYFVKRCAEHPAWCAKFTSPNLRGVPDRVCCIDGVTVFVEFKAPGQKLSPHQERTIDKMIASGCVVWLIDSFEGVNALFTELGKC